MDFGSISAALSSIGALQTIANGLVSIRDEAKLTTAKMDLLNEVISLQSTVIALQQQMSELTEREREAKEEARQLREEAQERESYTLFQIRPGAYAYAGKPEQLGEELQPPYFCQACYHQPQSVRSILQFIPARPGLDAHWHCAQSPQHKIYQPGTAPPYEMGRR